MCNREFIRSVRDQKSWRSVFVRSILLYLRVSQCEPCARPLAASHPPSPLRVLREIILTDTDHHGSHSHHDAMDHVRLIAHPVFSFQAPRSSTEARPRLPSPVNLTLSTGELPVREAAAASSPGPVVSPQCQSPVTG